MYVRFELTSADEISERMSLVLLLQLSHKCGNGGVTSNQQIIYYNTNSKVKAYNITWHLTEANNRMCIYLKKCNDNNNNNNIIMNKLIIFISIELSLYFKKYISDFQ